MKDLSYTKKWLLGWLIIVFVVLLFMAGSVITVDPFFHYRAPKLDKYFYYLDNERSQNDGITKHFTYDAMVTGTSMTQNFKTSDLDAIFGVHSVKTPYAGATFKEIADNLNRAFIANPNLKTVVRGLDLGLIVTDKDTRRSELGSFPDYLYDDDYLNDVNYVLNKDVIFRSLTMQASRLKQDFTPGITSFDEYSNWQKDPEYVFGVHSLCPDGIPEVILGAPVHLTDEEREIVEGNIEQNVIALAKAHPDVDFYIFLTPYSMAFWMEQVQSGLLYRIVEAEHVAVEMMLEQENIRVYGFGDKEDMVSDLNNYKDPTHYGEWINTMMLYWMKNGEGLLTKENYKDYINHEILFPLNFDYTSLAGQEDYENDMDAAKNWQLP